MCGRSDRRGKLPPSYHLTRGEGDDREVRPADVGQVKRLVSLRWVAESGREGDDSVYTLTASGKVEAAKAGPQAGLDQCAASRHLAGHLWGGLTGRPQGDERRALVVPVAILQRRLERAQFVTSHKGSGLITVP